MRVPLLVVSASLLIATRVAGGATPERRRISIALAIGALVLFITALVLG